MTINVAINGFGRIGRNILRAKYENEEYSDIKIVAINDLGDSETNAHLLQYDTAHGKFRFDVKSEKNKIIVDNSCLLYTSPSPRDGLLSRMPSSA